MTSVRKLALATSLFIFQPAIARIEAQGNDSIDSLTGLWKAKQRFGPDARGVLLIQRAGQSYTAQMMGFTIPVRRDKGELMFELPNREGGFRGKVNSGMIRGFWFSGPVGTTGSATPVTLSATGANRWSGHVQPLEENLTWYLLLSRRPDGSLAAVVRNIERDLGGFFGIRGAVRSGKTLNLVGRRGS